MSAGQKQEGIQAGFCHVCWGRLFEWYMLKKVFEHSIFVLTPWENVNTDFSMYRRKASDAHLPSFMIVSTGVPAR